MTIKNITGSFIDLYGLITNEEVEIVQPGIPTYNKTGINGGATIDLLLFNTPGRIFECFELWRQIAAGNIRVICDGTELNAVDSLKAFQTQNFQCLLDSAVIPPAPLPDPLCLGNVKLDPTKWITAAINGNINDFNDAALPGAIGIRFTSNNSANDLNGVTAQADGKLLIIGNEGSSNRFDIENNDPASLPANRFLLAGNRIRVNPGEFIWFFYDGTVSRWRPINGI